MEIGLACIFKFHAHIKNGWCCTESLTEWEIKFPAPFWGDGVQGMHKRMSGHNSQGFKIFSLWHNNVVPKSNPISE